MNGYWRDLWRSIKPSTETIHAILHITGGILVGMGQALLIFFCLSIFTSNFIILFWASPLSAMLLTSAEAVLWVDYEEYKKRVRNKKEPSLSVARKETSLRKTEKQK